MQTRRSAPDGIAPIEGKVGKSATTATSGGNIPTGPVGAKRMPKTGMSDVIPFNVLPAVEDTITQPVRQP
jgi:hypothetical protein